MYPNYRKADIEKHISKIGFSPIDVIVTGATGVGKSSTLNSLFDREEARVGDGVDPETMTLEHYSLTDKMRFWDTPGLGDGIQKDREHARKITQLLRKKHHGQYGFLDMAVVIAEAGSRDLGTTMRLIEHVLSGNISQDRILVVLNQADFAMKGHHWNSEQQCPDSVLLEFLNEKALSLQQRIRDSTGLQICKPVYYSATKHYNIEQLYDMIVDHMPYEPRRLSDGI